MNQIQCQQLFGFFFHLFIAAPMFATAQTAVNAQQNLTGASMIQILH